MRCPSSTIAFSQLLIPQHAAQDFSNGGYREFLAELNEPGSLVASHVLFAEGQGFHPQWPFPRV